MVNNDNMATRGTPSALAKASMMYNRYKKFFHKDSPENPIWTSVFKVDTRPCRTNEAAQIVYTTSNP